MDSRVKEKYQNQNKYLSRPGHPVPSRPDDPVFIQADNEFAKALSQMCGKSPVAVDLEADSMFHFKEKVCLIQMAAGHAVYIIDPLAVSDASGLSKVLSDGNIRKIMHGADYDIRCLHRDFEITVNNLFDTELAARFLGYAETGLDALLKTNFNVTLEKKYQKKDWSQRPLPREMIDYAANDVRYLTDLYQVQTDELKKKNRLEWVIEECEHLSKVRNHAADDQPLFTRVKGAGRLNQRELAILESLLKYRLEEARRKDRPPFKIIENFSLLKIVNDKPTGLKRLKNLHILSEGQVARHGQSIIEMVGAALALPKDQLPRYPYKALPVIDARVSSRIKKLKIWRQKKVDSLKMDPGVLFGNSVLKSLAEKKPSTVEDLSPISEMKNWQKKEFGREIIDILKKEKIHDRDQGGI